MNQHLITVDFHGDTIFVAEAPGLAAEATAKILVAVKPICRSLSVDWEGQRQRIYRDTLLSEAACIIQAPSPGGMQETTCLPLDMMPGFLFGIDDRRIEDPRTRERVLLYKRECHRVLHDHFFGRRAVDDLDGPIPEPQYALEHDQVTLALRLIREVRLVFGLAAARAMWARLPLPLPPLDQVAPDLSGDDEPLDAFLASCIVATPGAVHPRQMFYDAYCAWAAANGETPVSMIGFGVALKRHFRVRDRRVTGPHGRRVWCYGGIALNGVERAGVARAGAVH